MPADEGKKPQDDLSSMKATLAHLQEYFAEQAAKSKKAKTVESAENEGDLTQEMQSMYNEFPQHVAACLTELENIEKEVTTELAEEKKQALLAGQELSEEDTAKILEAKRKLRLEKIAKTIFTLACASDMRIKDCLAFAEQFGVKDLSAFDLNTGLSPLAAAMLRRKNSLQAMEELESAGVDVNAVSIDGNNIAHLAALFGVRKAIIDNLIANKVNFNQLNKNKMTPLDMAVGRRNLDFMKYLINIAGAKFNFTPPRVQQNIKESLAQISDSIKRTERTVKKETEEEKKTKEEQKKEDVTKDAKELKDPEKDSPVRSLPKHKKQQQEEIIMGSPAKAAEKAAAPQQQALQTDSSAALMLIAHMMEEEMRNKEREQEAEKLRRQKERDDAITNPPAINDNLFSDFLSGAKKLADALSGTVEAMKYVLSSGQIVEANVSLEGALTKDGVEFQAGKEQPQADVGKKPPQKAPERQQTEHRPQTQPQAETSQQQQPQSTQPQPSQQQAPENKENAVDHHQQAADAWRKAVEKARAAEAQTKTPSQTFSPTAGPTTFADAVRQAQQQVSQMSASTPTKPALSSSENSAPKKFSEGIKSKQPVEDMAKGIISRGSGGNSITVGGSSGGRGLR